jgi:polyisoprenoid-binding protein YceI
MIQHYPDKDDMESGGGIDMTIWKLDADHTAAEFSVRHMMITTVRGKFKNISGTLNFDPEQPENATIEARIDATTIHTGTADRDTHLRSADFLDVENHPALIFKSTSIEMGSTNRRGKVIGDLTIRDVTKSVTLDVEFFGEDTSLYGDKRVGFIATTWINREHFGLTWNKRLESGTWLVDREVKITLDVQAVQVAGEKEVAA